MPRQLNSSLTIVGGTGVTASNSGVGFDGTEQMTQEISVGNDIRTIGNVQFNQITSSGYLFDTTTLTGNGSWNSNFTNTGNMGVTGNLTIPTSATVGGIVIAEKITAELTSSGVIFNSGSTIFGDDINDTHYVTGSVYNSGSISLLGYNITEISNDTSLTDSSTTALITETAIKTYTDTELGTLGQPTIADLYLRKRFTKSVSSISNNTASFTAVTASAPGSLTSTTENDFIFFINGNVMEHDALTIEQNGSTFLLKVDGSGIGYNLHNDDEIRAWGKFND
ncbi:hypothetical protein HOE22_10150 [Candidatus Woesearchaeota archaeon]|jgi:hypothetical protein|nr:hypothetical protein [Candidatus Woesearchaeota archaeon]MBT5758961.1 hypothetical protein [Candidatus Neomarinimicrobiota bacterium]